ncbi:uncharacterized protein PAC_03195 [Phialocephala subalpina]|uniref:DUF7357 domain-containing protein n=1 Tax=Phialocephala subalpina TaxID=576137 RepID=A0A1L7WKL2_9HELO|nr:uncharacterized protein PAC_03195 [Phialocephala subalpina]
MRLRLTVKRHGLPDTPVVWVVDTTSSPSPTVSQLLEAVNEAIPIESDGEWGLEDYAVELKGANGANYECLHFQHLAVVMKEDDEVIIRPLLTQDLKIRRVSGRRQISAEGKHLFDGLAFGRPLLRRPADRPPIRIPPRKKRRVTYGDDEQDDEEIPALMEREEDGSDSDTNKQLVLHADFDDEDSEDDEDFVPGEDDEGEDEEIDEVADDNAGEEVDEDSNPVAALIESARTVAKEYEDELDNESEDEDAAEISNPSDELLDEPVAEAQDEIQSTAPILEAAIEDESPDPADVEDPNESALKQVPEHRRIQIRKLHSAFPKSPMAVCKYVFNGSKGDMGEAYEAMARGFRPVKPKSAITELPEDSSDLSVPKTRLKAKTPPVSESSSRDIMEEDPEETPNSLVQHYDQNGLPLGSIKSGKALSFMAEALHTSPFRPRSQARRSASVVSNKSVRFTADDGLSNGLTSTPFIDKKSPVVESSSGSSDSDSDDSSEEEATTSDDSDSDESSSEESSGVEEDAPHAVSSSGSDDSSDSSGESSSEDESPEETSSKPSATIVNAVPSSPSSRASPRKALSIPEAQRVQATRKRNQRRRVNSALNRYKKKGILPAGTTVAELMKIRIDDDTTPEAALAKLEEAKAADTKTSSTRSSAQPQSEDFERRRQQLLESLASGGIEVGPDARECNKSAPVQVNTEPADPEPVQVSGSETGESRTLSNSFTTAPEQVEPVPVAKAPEAEAMDVDASRPSTALEAPKIDTPLASLKPQPASAEPSQSAARRSKLDLGAGRRLLFGALGMKAPRTKKDEEKLRTDLMKDVRPLVTPKPSEAIEVQPQAAEEDPEAWREKIVYRAVECVQEGVELSEPPFPFVQRWDPQQRSWPHNGKRKQAEREQPQYHQENSRASKKQKRRKGKHNYAEEQEYLDASYEPSYQELSYQDDDIELQYDDSTQLTRPEDENVEEEISMQLMNDIEGPGAAVSQAPDDLTPLPDDPSTLSDLKDGEAKDGMTIAFKMLELSAATHWQPLVSPYRTAIVIEVQEDGMLKLSLAMRDRKQDDKRYDEETGARVYEKFEMAGEDDEQDNDGMLNLPFGDLIEPKIVGLPPVDLENDDLMDDASQRKEATSFDQPTALSQQEEAAGSQPSHVTETPLHSDAPESYHIQDSIEVSVAEDPSPEVAVPEVTVFESASVEKPMPTELEQVEDASPTHVDEFSTADLARPAVEEALPTGVEMASTTDLVNPAVEYAAPTSVVEEASPTDPANPAAEDFVPTLTVEETSTAAARRGNSDELPSRNGVSVEPVSEDARQQIAHLMKDAEFRPDVPSPILRDTQPDSMQSLGEAADLEQLLKDMTEQNEKAYSPRYNGLGSSPVKKLRGSSRSLSESRVEVLDSSPTHKRKAPSRDPIDERQPSESPNKPQSSWETVDLEYQSPSPPSLAPAQQADSSWVTEDSHVKSSSPVASRPARKSLSRPRPVSKAHDLWEQLKPKNRTKSPDSEAESTRTSPDRAFGLDGVDERDSTVQYPKLSGTSSFTSQIQDHGRQPDFDFDDSVAIGGDTPKAADFDADITRDLSPQRTPQPSQSRIADAEPSPEPASERQPSNFKAVSPLVIEKDPFDSMSDSEPVLPAPKVDNPKAAKPTSPTVLADPDSEDELPARKAVSKERGTATTRPAVFERQSSSDDFPRRKFTSEKHIKPMAPPVVEHSSDSDFFPSLEALSQQSATIKREKSREKSTKPSRPPNASRPRTASGTSRRAADLSQDEDQTTPKASQKQRAPSHNQSFKSRGSEKPATQPRASQPPASQKSVIPPGSQVFDLTLESSSDVEPESQPAAAADDSSDAPPPKFRRYNLDSDDDEDYQEDSPGWVPKKSSTVGGVATRRHTSVSLKASSQTSLNSKNRRKTSSK